VVGYNYRLGRDRIGGNLIHADRYHVSRSKDLVPDSVSHAVPHV
jgi:hypothetical protein